ncbi:MAG: FtsX-like permease family protein [Bacteroidia bacterium]|nr:FtsX-like permease family protein [Bacteroidia bacterium]
MATFFRSVNLEIALTHLLSKPRQTLVAMLGVTFGISMFITMISFMTGVNDFLMNLSLDGTPHVRLFNTISGTPPPIAALTADAEMVVLHHAKPRNVLPKLKDGFLVLENVQQHPGVSGALAQVSSQVFCNNGPVKFPGQVVGTDILRENALYDLQEKMKSGDIRNLLTYQDGILIGKGLAEKLGVVLGDRISMTTPEGNTFFFRVAGIFAFGIATVDDTRCYASIPTVQKLLQADPSYITDIHVRLKDYNTSASVAAEMERTYGFEAEDWQEANQAILAGEVIRNSLTYVVSITMLIVAGFGIYNIMNMNIINKMKDIAILKAMGFEGSDVSRIFLIQSMMIGVAGGLLGLLLGFLFSTGISKIPFPNGDFISIETFPVSFHAQHYGLGITFGTLTTLFAGWFPSRKAARVDPVDIIRG